MKSGLLSSGSNKNNPSTPVIVLDIGSTSIRALVVEVKPNSIKVLGKGQVEQKVGDVTSRSIVNLDNVINNCDQALNQAEKEAGVNTQKVVVGLSSELIKCVNNTTQVRRLYPEREIDEDEFNQIVRVSQTESEKQALAETKLELGFNQVNLKLINSALVRLEVDGQKLIEPYNIQGSYIKAEVCNSFAPLVIISSIKQIIKQLDLKLLAFTSEAFGLAQGMLGDEFNSKLEGLLINIGGETTDVAIIIDGSLEDIRTFPIGSLSFSRAVSRHFEIPLEEAEKLKRDFNDDKKNKKRDKLETILGNSVDIWLTSLKLVLNEFKYLKHIPDKVFLAGSGGRLDLVPAALKSTSWPDDLLAKDNLVVQNLQAENFINLKDEVFLKKQDHNFATALGLSQVALSVIYSD